MNCLRISGYDHKYRVQALNGILKLEKEIECKIIDGQRLRYRPGCIIKQQKRVKYGGYADTWFLKEGFTNTMLVQCIVDSDLKREMFKTVGSIIGPDGGKTKIIEKAGRSLMSGLRKGDPYYDGECPYKNKCIADENTDCTRYGGVYGVECECCILNTDNEEDNVDAIDDDISMVQDNLAGLTTVFNKK